ncbi:alkaline phosphatase D family protein [Algoriphagus sediminis]|uniref:Alkaline phosphatase D family protein n=1 Tax=Algoriphagus sediminis TaxID=3057113 RepID=A0ABT7YAT8_9BACT|nr:alkaline phosphatase D family protein [Algoriphagus sediminis]MDN3203627.1 alkaline phosphatase D family protein [Algoriphagus sediminis]
MKTAYYPVLFLALIIGFSSCKKTEESAQVEPFKIAIGSCNKHDEPQPLWNPILADSVDAWVWLGDNIYGDTEDMDLLRSKYDAQDEIEKYSQLKSQVPIYGIWDDHDYGRNDGDKNYPKKSESKQIMLDFLDVPEDAPERKREGAYSSHLIGEGENLVKLILLDARYFRDTLSRIDGAYLPNEQGTILGEEQWAWLEKELSDTKPKVTLIASGIQILPTQHRFEKWANFPQERVKLLDLLAASEVRNPILLSGDRHIAEIMKYEDDRFPEGLFEFTSSGLTHTWSTVGEEANDLREGDLIAKLNYGLIIFDWENSTLVYQVKGENGNVYASQSISLK